MPGIDISSLNIAITGDVTQFNEALGQVQQSINAAMGTSLGAGNGPGGTAGQIAQTNQQLTQQKSRWDENTRALGRYLQRLIVIYGTFKLIDAASNFLGDAVRLAGEAEQAQVAFTALLGSQEQSKEILQDLVKFSEFTPFRLEDVKQAAKLLANANVEYERILPTLRNLGDIAAGAGVDLKELTRIYAQSKNEGLLFTRDIRQFATLGIPIINGLADAMGRLPEEIYDMASEGEISFGNLQQAIIALSDETGNYFKLTEDLSQTFLGQWTTFQDEMDGLKRELGMGLIPALTDVLALTRAWVEALRNAQFGSMNLSQSVQELTQDFFYVAAGMGIAVNEAQLAVLKLQNLLNKSIAGAQSLVPKDPQGLRGKTFTQEKFFEWLFGMSKGDMDSAVQAFDLEIKRQEKQLEGWREMWEKAGVDIEMPQPPEGKRLEDFLKEIQEELARTKKGADDLKNALQDVNAAVKGSDADVRARQRSLLPFLDDWNKLKIEDFRFRQPVEDPGPVPKNRWNDREDFMPGVDVPRDPGDRFIVPEAEMPRGISLSPPDRQIQRETKLAIAQQTRAMKDESLKERAEQRRTTEAIQDLEGITVIYEEVTI